MAGPGFDLEREVLLLAEQSSRMVGVAQALAQSFRRVDVDGLQQQIGFLCAKSLDLPPGQTGFARIELQRLATRLDDLHTALRAMPA